MTYLSIILKELLKNLKKVSKIRIFNKEYILKFIDLPMTYFELVNQHKFVSFLRKNGILTPKIYFSRFLSIFKIELQEYVYTSNEKYSDKEIVSSLATFHDVSYLYKEVYAKKKYYKVKQQCNNIFIDKILIEFKEKYYFFPVKNVDRNDIKKLYNLFYNEFILHYYKEDCIIHNDISFNNMYFHNNDVCIIDFDFSVKGSIYVDFVDAIVKRTYSINTISEQLIKKHNLEKYIEIYNKKSNNFYLDYKGCLLMIGLKVLAYNFFVLSKSNSKEKFKKNLTEIKKLLELLKGEYYDN